MSNYILYKRKNPKGTYVALGISKGYRKGIGNLVGLGYWEDIKDKYRLSSVDDLKEIARKIDTSLDKTSAKEEFFKLLVPTSVKTSVENVGLNLISKVIRELELFNNLPKTKQKDLGEVLEFVIVNWIIIGKKYGSKFKNKNDFVNDKKLSKSSIYSYFDVIYKNKDSILKNIFDKLNHLTNRDNKALDLGLINTHFYSVDQNDVADNSREVMIINDSNGIPIYYKMNSKRNSNHLDIKSLVKEIETLYGLTGIKITQMSDLRMIRSIFSSISILGAKDNYLETYILLLFIGLAIVKYCFYKLLKYYENSKKNKKITFELFLNSIDKLIVIKKVINGEVVAEIINDLDEQHKDEIEICKDFINSLS